MPIKMINLLKQSDEMYRRKSQYRLCSVDFPSKNSGVQAEQRNHRRSCRLRARSYVVQHGRKTMMSTRDLQDYVKFLEQQVNDEGKTIEQLKFFQSAHDKFNISNASASSDIADDIAKREEFKTRYEGYIAAAKKKLGLDF